MCVCVSLGRIKEGQQSFLRHSLARSPARYLGLGILCPLLCLQQPLLQLLHLLNQRARTNISTVSPPRPWLQGQVSKLCRRSTRARFKLLNSRAAQGSQGKDLHGNPLLPYPKFRGLVKSLELLSSLLSEQKPSSVSHA